MFHSFHVILQFLKYITTHLLSLNSGHVILEVHARSPTEEVYVTVSVAGIHVHENSIAPVLA